MPTPYWREIENPRPRPTVTRAASVDSDIKNPAAWLQAMFSAGIGPTIAGIPVTPLKALGVATVQACVRLLTDTIATLPLEVRVRTQNERRLAPEHRLFTALNLSPNPEMTSADARSALISNLVLRQKSYAEILFDGDGDVIGFYPIETTRMDVYRLNDARKSLRYRVTDVGAVFTAREVIHLKTNTFDGIQGTSISQTARDCIALAIALQDNAVKFFGNGSRPSAVLEHPQTLSDEAQERLKKQVIEATGGERAYNLLVLEEGLKFAKERSENKDSQFIEAKDAQNLELCRLFGVPPRKVGIMSGSSQPQNIEDENIGFVTDVVRPYCVRIEQEFDRKLFTQEERDQGLCVRHDLNALMRGNRKAIMDAMAIGRQWTILSQDDCRDELELPRVKGGNTFLQPLNMAPHDRAMEILLKNGNSSENTGLGSQKKA